jgi:predicted RNase H-like nuclease
VSEAPALDTDRVMGVDAAGRIGWVGIVIDESGFVDAGAGPLADLIRWAEPVAAVAVDIPIGNVPGGARLADVEARRFVGVRRSSVFSAPAIDALQAASYGDANLALDARGAPRLSQQSWALVPKIREADAVANGDVRVFEVHPEVSFRALAHKPLAWSKKSWNGLLHRRRLLAEAGIDLPEALPGIGGVGADDVIDAAVAAWSARRFARGEARSLPDPAQVVGNQSIAIWY